jgi:hypothetical protein
MIINYFEKNIFRNKCYEKYFTDSDTLMSVYYGLVQPHSTVVKFGIPLVEASPNDYKNFTTDVL